MGSGMKNFTPLGQNSNLGKKGGGHPKSGKNSTNSDLAQTFRISSAQYRIVIGGENLYQNSMLGKKGGSLKIRQTFNLLRFGSNFQGNLRPTKDCDWQ